MAAIDMQVASLPEPGPEPLANATKFASVWMSFSPSSSGEMMWSISVGYNWSDSGDSMPCSCPVVCKGAPPCSCPAIWVMTTEPGLQRSQFIELSIKRSNFLIIRNSIPTGSSSAQYCWHWWQWQFQFSWFCNLEQFDLIVRLRCIHGRTRAACLLTSYCPNSR